MIRDRGNIKWTAMMLPEHVAKLRDWMDKDRYIERPVLEDFDLQSIQEEIEVAYKRKCQTLLKTWIDGKIIPYQGTIEKIDIHSKCIILEDPFGIERIPVADVISVQCID